MTWRMLALALFALGIWVVMLACLSPRCNADSPPGVTIGHVFKLAGC